MKNKPNFSGYATKYGVLCTDGRTIVANAFGHEDGKKLPLMWRHDDNTPENVLGHVILTHVAGDGVKAEAFLNKTARGEHTRTMIEHGDINSLSIKAVRVKQNGNHVTYGDLAEVSVVPSGANSGARIDSVYLEHSDGLVTELEDQIIIHSGIEFVHADEDEDETPEADSKERTLADVYDTMTEEQKDAVAAMLAYATSGNTDDDDDDDEEPSVEQEDLEHEGENMTRNVFDKDGDSTGKSPNSTTTLTHEQQADFLAQARRNGSLRDFVQEANTLEHAGLEGPYGVTNIEALFPEPKQVTDRPEWIKRDTSWVASVLSGVKSVPFTRIKSASADVTHEEARAKGYIKGNMKKNEFFAVASRTTEAKTIYKRQGFDRDDLLDITDFDVVAWVKEEMRWMLQEEVARAILFGDNRPIEDPDNPGEPNPDKINEENIRPIATDDEFYTARLVFDADEDNRQIQKQILRSRKLLRGASGKPTLYTNTDLVIDMLLMEDKLGRRYYETEASLAAALGVRNIVEVEVLDEEYLDEDGNRLVGVLVNLADYTFGANRGGQETMFEDFDIDYNQHKYLIETRRAGALTKHRSAVSLWTAPGFGEEEEEPEEPELP